jgi:hypothetical protein
VPCPATPWRHPEDRKAFEVRWSAKKKRGVTKVYYFYACSVCEPKTQVFLNDWTPGDGYTIPGAEADGWQPKVTRERKMELLAELGLEPVPLSPPTHLPGPNGYTPLLPGPQAPAYAPVRKKNKRPRVRRRRS